MDNNDDDNDFFGEIKDPYDRLEEIEAGLINHARHIQNSLRQVKQNARLIVQISEGMKEMAKAIDQLQQQQLYIYKIIKEQNESQE